MKHAAIWAVLCCLASAVASAEQFQDRLSIYNERHLCSVGPPSRCNQELAARAVSVSAYLVTGTSSSLSSFSTPSKTLDAVKWNTPVYVSAPEIIVTGNLVLMSSSSPALFPVSTAAAAESPKITMAIPRSLHLPAQVMAESSTWANKSLSGWSYVGCFGPKSSHSRRNSTASWNYNSVNSLDKCAERCSNSQYYGVANRFDCQCGDSIDDKSIIKAPESNCNLTCAWPHNNQFCGGNSYMGVYRNAQGSSKNRTFGMTVNSTMSRYVVPRCSHQSQEFL